MAEDNDALREKQIRAALERGASALEEVYETIADLDAGQLSVAAWQKASARAGVLLSEFDKASGQVNRLLGLGGGQERLLTYLRSRVGERVRMEELRGVAAIYEWARRVRELRVEKGWPIATNVQRADLAAGEYVLEKDAPDDQLAADWRLAKDMRNLRKANGRPESGKTRGLEYLKALSPRPADKEQLTYVMNISSHARRIRELSEEGWRIVSNIDDPSLASGSYRLESLDKRPPRVRQAIKLRHEVLDRDGYKCSQDGATPEKDGVTLQIHHIKYVSQGGTNDIDNLVTLCHICHAGRHALERGQAKDELLNPDWAEDVAGPGEG